MRPGIGYAAMAVLMVLPACRQEMKGHPLVESDAKAGFAEAKDRSNEAGSLVGEAGGQPASAPAPLNRLADAYLPVSNASGAMIIRSGPRASRSTHSKRPSTGYGASLAGSGATSRTATSRP